MTDSRDGELPTNIVKSFEEKFFDMAAAGRADDVKLYLTGTVKNLFKAATQNRQNKGLKDQLSLNAGRKYCRMLQGEHSAMLLTCIK